jgi:hypothetical protein
VALAALLMGSWKHKIHIQYSNWKGLTVVSFLFKCLYKFLYLMMYVTERNREGQEGAWQYCVYAKFENYVVRLPHTHLNFHRIIEIIDPIRL